jgi:phospholipase/carboxylesterase
METIQRQGESLTYLTVHPSNYRPEESYPLIILLHGFGADMYDLASLAPAIDHTGYVYVCPNAPVAFQIGPGMVGYGWGAPGATEDQRSIDDMLRTLFSEVIEQYKVSPGRVILGGFSQGAGMTYRCGLDRPDLFAGLIALSGGPRDLDQLRAHLPSQRTQAIFVAHGTDDPMVPIERARNAVAFLKEEGYTPVYNEYRMGHEIPPEVLTDLVPWIHAVLTPWHAM